MHLGNSSVTPECGLIALGISATAAGMALRSLQKESITRDRALSAGALGSLVFALQMTNFDVAQLGSAHLIGGVLTSWFLGAPLGLLTMAVVLSVQAILLGDGGIISLGANIINMAISRMTGIAAMKQSSQAAMVSVLDRLQPVAALAATALAGVLVWGLGVGLVRHRAIDPPAPTY